MQAKLNAHFVARTLAKQAGVLAIAIPITLGTVAALGKTSQAQQPPRVVRPDLEIGVQDFSVAELQAALKLLGFYEGSVSGNFSPATSQAVARFQAAAGLPNTGRVNARTWDSLFPPASGAIAAQPAPVTRPRPLPKPNTPALVNEPASPAPQPPAPATTPARPAPKPAPVQQPAKPNPFPTLREGAEGDAVARLQRLLQRQGVFEGSVDGDFGPKTLEAVIAAQEKLGLEADGVVGPATWSALRP